MSSKVRAFVRDTVSQMTESEQKEVLDWAEKSLVVIQTKELSPRKKYALIVNRKAPRSVRIMILAMLRLIRSKTWTGQSWARRMGVLGATAGTIGLGGKAAGVVSMGLGLSISLPFVATLVATFLGVVIDELSKEVNEFKNKKQKRQE